MNLYAFLFLVCTAAYALLGIWAVFARQERTHKLYGALCLMTCFWQGIWAMLFGGVNPDSRMFWLRLCYAWIVFIPATLHHLISAFTHQEMGKRWVRWMYGLSLVLCAAVWYDSLFIKGFRQFSWGVAAKAGPLHPLFGILVAVVIVRIGVLLYGYYKNPDLSDLKKKQVRFVGLATLIYCGGALDLLPQYGVSFFPVSFIFLSVSLILFGYAIVRYDFLALSASGETDEDRQRREAASAQMQEMGMAAAFPLVSQGEVMGYLLLGEKMSEESYSKEDLLLLRIVANQAALAYQRVQYLEMAVHGARTEMLGEIAGGFAHEIKTPLANISLPAEMTIMDLEDLESGKQTIQELVPQLKLRMREIMKQAFKASEKIEAVRQFSKPGEVELEPVDVRSIVRNSLGLLEHLVRRTGVQVQQEFPDALAAIRGDSKQLEIVFVNLIKNAAEAMSLHTTNALARKLNIRANEEGDWVVVNVKDSGPGIKKTHFGHLFEAYFTTKGSEGTGMGLFLSQQMIKAHGGSIDVKSEEGKGTEFIIKLPKFVAQEHNVHRAA
jgi:signal transduction histidine kinase